MDPTGGEPGPGVSVADLGTFDADRFDACCAASGSELVRRATEMTADGAAAVELVRRALAVMWQRRGEATEGGFEAAALALLGPTSRPDARYRRPGPDADVEAVPVPTDLGPQAREMSRRRAVRRRRAVVMTATALLLVAAAGVAFMPSGHHPAPVASAPGPAPAEHAVTLTAVATVEWFGGYDERDLSVSGDAVAWADHAVSTTTTGSGADEVVLGRPSTGGTEVVARADPGRTFGGVVISGDVVTWVDFAAAGAATPTAAVRARSLGGGTAWTVQTLPSGPAPVTSGRDGLLAWVTGGVASEIQVARLDDRTVRTFPSSGADSVGVVDPGTLVVGVAGQAPLVFVMDLSTGMTRILEQLLDPLKGMSTNGQRVLVLERSSAPGSTVVTPELFDLGAPTATPFLLAPLTSTTGLAGLPVLGDGWTVSTTDAGLRVAALAGTSEQALNPALGGGTATSVDGGTIARFLVGTASAAVPPVVVQVTSVTVT